MSVFKKIQPKNKKITPYQAHKQFSVCNINSDGIEIYDALFSNSFEPNATISQSVANHYSISNLFYYEYNIRSFEKLGQSNTNQHRYLDYKATIFSIPQSKFMEQVKQGSVSLYVSSSLSGEHNFEDDNYGNIIDTDIQNDLFDTLHDIEVVNYAGENNYLNIDATYSSIHTSHVITNGVQYDNNQFYDKSDNKINGTFHNVSFKTGSLGTEVDFDENNSFIRTVHNDKLNFNTDDEFCVSAIINITNYPSSTQTIVTKNGLYNEQYKDREELSTGNFIETIKSIDRYKNFAYPYQIQMNNSGSIIASRFDGTITTTVSDSTDLNDGSNHHIIFQKSNDTLELIIDGILVDSSTDLSVKPTTNIANFYIGRLQNVYFDGKINKVKIYNRALTTTEYLELATRELNNTFDYYAGNIFYNHGIITLTNPYYWDIDSSTYELNYRNTKTIYEHEYICIAPAGDLNYTLNPTIRIQNSPDEQEVTPVYLTDVFSPYITTIGLYDDSANLLALGKISIPIKKLKKLDTNFVVRFDV